MDWSSESLYNKAKVFADRAHNELVEGALFGFWMSCSQARCSGPGEKVSVEHLVNVLFGVLHPFVGMMRDLLDYFALAGVTDGPNQWKLPAIDARVAAFIMGTRERKRLERTTNTTM